MFLRLLIPGGIGFSGCFFSVYWLPFATIPFTLDALLQSILYPADFFLGGMAFLVGMWGHSTFLRNWISYSDKKIGHYVLFFLIFLSPVPLIILSLKVVIAFFIFVLFYGMITNNPTMKKNQEWQYESKMNQKL
ncbi:hypothetical protein [Pontibacillus yanchengensis]|uniref:Uncharacterized protein n=1 Tax=Pontibacillus yanchengensis Y32 TaxID=1385514 RepID=A0A0A2T6U4_9BACI|nr:hypothetical protein [Pontibacillus yanchengensis]KGP71517.1 hypothetical protein N782_18550 [Pontibacillus yanchengensis Y32]